MKCPNCGNYFTINDKLGCDCGYVFDIAKEEKESFIYKNRFLLWFFAGLLIYNVSGMVAKQQSEKANERDRQQIAKDSGLAPIKAYLTSQSSEGTASEDLTIEGLSNIESWVKEVLTNKIKDYYIENGLEIPKEAPSISSQSGLITVDQVKLGVITINVDNAMRERVIVGIKEGKFLRVTCIRESNHDIPISYGNCGDFITKTFGVVIGPSK